MDQDSIQALIDQYNEDIENLKPYRQNADIAAVITSLQAAIEHLTHYMP